MVGVGGCLGSMLRFWVGSYIGSRMGTRFPYGTLVINITGSFLIGLVFALLTARTHWSPELAISDPNWLHRRLHNVLQFRI